MGKIIETEVQLPIKVIIREETPIISPLEIIDYDSSSIECAFDVSTEQAEEVVKGVLCGTINPPTFENADYRLLHGQGSMDLVFAGLHNNTEYYLRPYVLSNLGYKYEDVIAQKTKYSPIPDEYQLVEWIKSIGGYLDNIPIVPDNLTDYELYFKIDSAVCSGAWGVVGARVSYAGRSNCLDSTWNNSESAGWEYNGYSNFPMTYGQKVHFKSVHGMLYFNDNLVSDRSSQYGTYWNAGYNCGLFCKGGESAGNKKMTFYDFLKIRQADELVHDLYPVYRKSDNYVGLYCLVTNQFIPSVINMFTIGPDKEWEE